jgi:CheY-like chemotaxis protein
MSRLTNLSVLVVDDDPDSIEIARVMLESEGAKVISALTADQALAEVRSSRPDVVLCDIAMPTHDGYWLLRCIRATAAGRDLPVAALTAHASAAKRAEVLAAGFQMHIAKPADREVLVAAVRKLLTSGVKPRAH